MSLVLYCQIETPGKDEGSQDDHSCFVVVLGMLSGICPVWVPRLCLQCIAAPLGGVSAAVLTTPLDAIRARIQVIVIITVKIFFHYFLVYSLVLEIEFQCLKFAIHLCDAICNN